MSDPYGQMLRLLRVVTHEAKLEQKRLRRSKTEFGVLSALVAILLFVDYSAARIIFAYLDPTLGQVSLGPEVIALCVPIAVIAIHLLVTDDGGQRIEKRLQRLAGVGVFVFLFAIAGMLSLVYLESADGVGASSSGPSIGGTLGNQQLGVGVSDTPWFFALFQGLFSGIVPIVFFIGMTLILFVTVYASHKLLIRIEERYNFFVGASNRARELVQVFSTVEGQVHQLRQLRGRIKRAKSKLPGDTEHRFAEIASAAITEALYRMGKALRGLDGNKDVLGEIISRKPNVPDHITDQKAGRRLIAELRQATTPYAILTQLAGNAPQSEED